MKKRDLRTWNRGSLNQCASDQLTEFTEREKSYEQKKQSRPSFPAHGKGGDAIAREAAAEIRRVATEKRQGPTARDRIADPIDTKKKMKEKTQTKKKTKKREAI